ncbi:hypothetical protein W97_06993 [Coniosporium apollinis CBS 100218]|uniref:Succinate dehydrogenase assembly factor 4, mitochondrial n=1 Tax=Coniosporium apollinis (strain CBS 100218) TaxID=1168221 RepID=R7Z125_CONA1|nr:uncharacterized protein W97_06993 [Coniosporium apollinis CBS 100218]EON67739.1 hypothetical protein W97_06993 [Coniosporium apollinis CBS 100218]
MRSSTIRPLLRPLTRTFTTASRPQLAFRPSPAPPALPKEEQEIFEQLQKQSTGAFSTPASQPRIQINQSPLPTPEVNQADSTSSEARVTVNAEGKGEELHPNIRRGAPPEFEGDVNPKTGEVGGPKNEPLRWGYEGDWSYNGRVTDF